MSIRISAVVCTHNRAAYVRKALQSLVDQSLPLELHEIIVVDNASQDDTKQVISEFSNAANLRYLYEPVIGLSRARNTGWRNAQGTYVAYLDDDAIACPGWLAKFLSVFETVTPRPGSIGGKVDGIWEAPRPDWLSDKMLGFLAIVDWSDVPTVVNEGQWLPGCNVAYPRELLQKAGGFREDLGKQGIEPRQNDEIYLRHQLDSWGLCSMYHPEIVVGHHVPPSRLTKRYFRQITYWTGLSDAIMLNPDGRLTPALRARLGLTRIGWSLPRLFLMLISTNPAARFRRQCQILEAMGYVSGLWRLGAEAAQ